MMYTLREIASKLNLNKVTVFKHYKQLEHNKVQLMKNHTTTHKNRILLDKTAYSELVGSFNHLHVNANRNTNSSNGLMIIKLLKSELHDKNNQIVNLNEELKHQQELQLNEQRRNQSLIKSLEFNKINKKPTKKIGFWYKIKKFFK